MADPKPTNRERIKEIVTGIEDNIKELFQSEKYFDYLRTMSRFHSYSVNNTILIHMQRPDASLVAGFNTWKNKFGRHVKRGEKGITIIAPTPFKKKIEEMKLDPDTKAPVLDQNGNAVIEEKVVEIPLFKPVKVFDVSQTDGKPLPQLSADLTGDVRQFDVFMEALRRTAPVPMTVEKVSPGMDGYFDPEKQKIAIREGMSEVQTICAAVHEIAHSKLHNYEQARLTAAAGEEEPPKPKDRKTEEVEAESVSYAVCQYYCIDTAANSMGYIAGWSSGKELKELKASLDTITKTVSGLIQDIDRHFAEICKERGIDLTAQVEQTAPTLDGPDSPERFAADMLNYLESLAEAGEIPPPLGSLGREEVEKHYAVSLRHGNFSGCRSLLDETAGQVTTPTGGALVERLDKLCQEWEAGLSYEIKPFIPGSSIDRFYIEAHRQADDGFQFSETIFAGSKAACAELVQKLEAHALTVGEVRAMEIEDLPASETPAASQPEQGPNQALYLIDDTAYLHVQLTDTGIDYTFYDKETMRLMDGGQLDYKDPERTPEKPLESACHIVCAMEGKHPGHAEPVSLDMVETLQDAQFETPAPTIPHYEELVDHMLNSDDAPPSEPLPDAPETALDEYPSPDPDLTAEDLERCGYLDGDLLPLSKDRAAELIDKDMTVYILNSGENPVMAFDREEITEQSPGVLFAVPREEWEAGQDFQQSVADRMNHQEEREKAFLDHAGDCFAIYQVKDDPSLRDIRFESLDWLKSIGRTMDRSSYDLVYTAPLAPALDVGAALDAMWYQFNNECPADYQHPSMSVSDIVAIRKDGVLSCHYCDSFGFQPVPDFIKPENYLKSAEMSLEDDLGMVDGIINNGPKEGPTVAELEAQVKAGQAISLMDLAGAVHREQGEKKSVMARLHEKPPKQEKKRTAPKKSAERDR